MLYVLAVIGVVFLISYIIIGHHVYKYREISENAVIVFWIVVVIVTALYSISGYLFFN